MEKRKVTREMRDLFGLGWAPDRWDALTKTLTAEGFDKPILEAAGLSKESSTGNLIDRFRARVIFPIKDMQGRPIAFGGRVLEETAGGPKYLNSPETPIYNKSRVLYGLNLAAPSARRENRLIIVEGYMDVIALRGAGIDNCAAVSGTAFTPAQAEIIKRICDTVTAFFDSDEAGVAAAKKSLPVLLEKGLKTRVFSLPGAKDADEFLVENGPDQLAALLNKAPFFPQFVIDTAAASADLATVEGRSKAAREALPYINRIMDRIERGQYIQILADKTRLDLATLNKESAALAKGAPSGPRPAMASAKPKPKPRQEARVMAERILIRILLDRPDYLRTVAQELMKSDFVGEENGSLFELIVSAADGGAKTLAGVMEAARGVDLTGKVTERVMETNLYDEADSEKAARDGIKALKYRPEERKTLLKDQVSAAEGSDREKFADAKKKYIDSRKDVL
jgi:DNA primase